MSYTLLCTFFNFKIYLLYPVDESHMVLQVQAVAYI